MVNGDNEDWSGSENEDDDGNTDNPKNAVKDLLDKRKNVGSIPSSGISPELKKLKTQRNKLKLQLGTLKIKIEKAEWKKSSLLEDIKGGKSLKTKEEREALTKKEQDETIEDVTKEIDALTIEISRLENQLKEIKVQPNNQENDTASKIPSTQPPPPPPPPSSSSSSSLSFTKVPSKDLSTELDQLIARIKKVEIELQNEKDKTKRTTKQTELVDFNQCLDEIKLKALDLANRGFKEEGSELAKFFISVSMAKKEYINGSTKGRFINSVKELIEAAKKGKLSEHRRTTSKYIHRYFYSKPTESITLINNLEETLCELEKKLNQDPS